MQQIQQNLQQCGCNYFATKRISKTAVKVSETKLTTAFAWFLLLTIFTNMVAIVECNPAHPRKRHRQRSTSQLTDSDSQAISEEHRLQQNVDYSLQWVNPCGGETIENSDSRDVSAPFRQKRDSLLKLKRATEPPAYIVAEVKMSENFDADIPKRFHHKLECMKTLTNTNVTLFTWHKDLQIYVGGLYYLHKKQFPNEILKDNSTQSPKLPSYLKILLINAKVLLCEVETAINSTKRLSDVKHNLKRYSESEMLAILDDPEEKCLKPETFHVDRWSPASREDIDVLIDKFGKYVDKMHIALQSWQALARKRRHQIQKRREKRNRSRNSGESRPGRKANRKNRPKKQQRGNNRRNSTRLPGLRRQMNLQ